jgi:hypothetical protein
LLAEGIDPRLRVLMRRVDQDHDALRSTVGKAAGLTVKDDSCGKPVFRNWEAYRGPSAVPVVSPVRKDDLALPGPPDAPAIGRVDRCTIHCTLSPAITPTSPTARWRRSVRACVRTASSPAAMGQLPTIALGSLRDAP